MPTFNLSCKVWYAREWRDEDNAWTAGKPVDPPDSTVDGAIQIAKNADALWLKYVAPPYETPATYASAISRQLLLPRRTPSYVASFTSAPGDPLVALFTVVKAPSDRDQWYYCSDVYDIGRGHPNEFRIWAIVPIWEWWTFPID